MNNNGNNLGKPPFARTLTINIYLKTISLVYLITYFGAAALKTENFI